MQQPRVTRRIALLLALLQFFLPLLHPAFAAEPNLADKIHGKAGGWGIWTPIMVAGVGIYNHVSGEEDLDSDHFLNRELVGGLIGDFALVALMNKVVPMLPLPAVFKTALVIGSGFVGWEIGSGNLGETDWTNLLAQVATATTIQVGLQAAAAAMGISIGGLPILLASMAGAIGVGILLDEMRGEPEAESSERALAPIERSLTRTRPDGPLPPATRDPTDKAERDSLYKKLKEALGRGDRDGAESLWLEYDRSRGGAAPAAAR